MLRIFLLKKKKKTVLITSISTLQTVLCQKDLVKGNSVENVRPITCLPLMWKLLAGIISQDKYYFMENENLLPEEQK